MDYERGGIVFVGCIILGMGLGMVFDHQREGMFIGLGIGFILMAILGRRKAD
ncbi:MAG TPA: hypothetical protein VK061_02740 [Bacillota bacterium]|nr:hypothetical protein [Bacillota bacterium]